MPPNAAATRTGRCCSRNATTSAKVNLPEVAQRLGDEEHQRRPADQPAGRVDHAVVAAQRDQPGDAEEGRRAHVVAGQRQAVLQRAHAAPGGIELGRRPRSTRRPVGDGQRERHDHQEEGDRRGVGVPRWFAWSVGRPSAEPAAQPLHFRIVTAGSPRRRRSPSAPTRPTRTATPSRMPSVVASPTRVASSARLVATSRMKP